MPSIFNPWVILAVTVTLAASHGSVYLYARHEGRAAVLEKLKDDRIVVLKDGQKIDEKVLGADDSGLCILLGGCGLPE